MIVLTILWCFLIPSKIIIPNHHEKFISTKICGKTKQKCLKYSIGIDTISSCFKVNN